MDLGQYFSQPFSCVLVTLSRTQTYLSEYCWFGSPWILLLTQRSNHLLPPFFIPMKTPELFSYSLADIQCTRQTSNLKKMIAHTHSHRSTCHCDLHTTWTMFVCLRSSFLLQSAADGLLPVWWTRLLCKKRWLHGWLPNRLCLRFCPLRLLQNCRLK